MGKSSFAKAAVFVAAVILSGCQTAAIDTTSTAAVDPTLTAKDISEPDTIAGKQHFADANFGLAEKHFRKAVELRATNADAWMGLAASYDQLGRFDFSDRAYDQLLKVAGRQPRVINNMGYSQLLRGNKKKARSLLNEAIEQLPGDEVVLANLALLEKI